MKKAEKRFDSVAMMRTIRDALSKQLQGLSFNEERKMIQDRLRSRTTPRAKAHS